MNARDKAPFRIGKKYGTEQWQIKQAPGWKVVARCATLLECAEWFRANSVVDIHTIDVACNQHPWPTLGQLLAEGREPS